MWLHAVLDVPAHLHAPAASYWSRALGSEAGAPWRGHPELRSFEPPRGTPYVHLQEIEGPPRVHIDLEATEPGATVERARRLGATLVAEEDRWSTLESPGGLPFCIVAAGRHEPPAPLLLPDGSRSRLVQVCVDAPAESHESEVAFWRGLLGGRWAPSGAREFAGKWHDDAGSPLQLLFQRLDEPVGRVRAHLDLGTDDLASEVARLRTLGADEIGPGRGWHVLRDPSGLAFCVTENAPDWTLRRDIG